MVRIRGRRDAYEAGQARNQATEWVQRRKLSPGLRSSLQNQSSRFLRAASPAISGQLQAGLGKRYLRESGVKVITRQGSNAAGHARPRAAIAALRAHVCSGDSGGGAIKGRRVSVTVSRKHLLTKSRCSVFFEMNPQLANFILKKTPNFILHPTEMAETQLTLNTGAKIPALGMIEFVQTPKLMLTPSRSGNMAVRPWRGQEGRLTRLVRRLSSH